MTTVTGAPPLPLPLARLRRLDTIRCFVAVGRRMSITQAANDLCVTQPAMSRQIRELEDRLGVRLFIRGYRAIRFTPEGARLFAVADPILASLQCVLGGFVRAPRPHACGEEATGVGAAGHVVRRS